MVRAPVLGVVGDGTAVGIMHDGDGELHVGRGCDADTDESVVEQEAVRVRIGGCVGGAVGTVDGGEERIVAVGARVDETDSGSR